ncbi:unnamed protein product, partial [Adineta steineri]
GVLHNIDVIEKSKTNQFSLGKRLLIIDPRTQATKNNHLFYSKLIYF